MCHRELDNFPMLRNIFNEVSGKITNMTFSDIGYHLYKNFSKICANKKWTSHKNLAILRTNYLFLKWLCSFWKNNFHFTHYSRLDHVESLLLKQSWKYKEKIQYKCRMNIWINNKVLKKKKKTNKQTPEAQRTKRKLKIER